MTPDEVVAVATDDGWTLSLRHYAGDGPPVLLVHGMGANHNNWDWREDISLAAYLHERGWDVWIPELRGDPGSEGPTRDFSFDDHALHDLPAHVEAVLARTVEQKITWVGHSMGGMLLYTALALYPEKIAAGVAICSPSTMTDPRKLQRQAEGARWLAGRVATPTWWPLVSWLGRGSPVASLLANPDNLDWDMVPALGRDALVPIPRGMNQQVITWLEHDALTRVDGTPWLWPADVPVLTLGGSVDRIVDWRDVRATCDVLPDCTFQLLGAEGGFSVEYGHIDPVLGNTARGEVYPVIEAWLAARRGIGGSP